MPGVLSAATRPALDLKMRNLVQSGRPALDIVLSRADESKPAAVPTYSSMDRMEGVVTVTPQSDTPFSELEIMFEGTEKTYVEKVATTSTMAGRTTATHKFLRLIQPISPSALPLNPRVLKANQTYSVPFTFVVPSELLPRACNHKVAVDTIRQAHMQLPPSLGDPELAGSGAVLLDDMSPDMARVTYAIKAELTRARSPTKDPEMLAEKTKKIRVKPAFEEQPPLSVDAAMKSPRRGSVGPTGTDIPSDYKVRAEKTIKKGLFKGKLGELVMEASQPAALHIPFQHDPQVPITTMATVHLRFDPIVDKNGKLQDPPKLGSLTSKLKVSTFFATAPRQNIPSRQRFASDNTQGVYSETLQLANRCVESAQWTKHDASTPPTADFGRRDSAGSTTSASTSSTSASDTTILEPASTVKASRKETHFYTATLRVPISLPPTKNLVPTFHTCLISRIYALNLALSTQNTGPASSAINLRIPIQISASGSPEWQVAERERNFSLLSAVMEEVENDEAWEVDEQLRPRSMVVNPSALPHSHRSSHAAAAVAQMAGRRHSEAVQAPPGYESLMGPRVSVY